MSSDKLRKRLAAPDADDAGLAREIEADPALRAALASAAGLEDFEVHLRSFTAAASPLPAEVAELVERLATRAPDESHSLPLHSAEPTELGHYTGLTLIGRGGMGAVYRATDARLHRVVALKMLSPALAANPEARARFQREARAAAALSHPNILSIHAIETFEGRDVLVMPLNDGENLHALVRRDGPLPVEEIIRLGAAVADGLAAAHAAGIMHRDIKPANLLVSADGRDVRIADFGLAHIADDPAHTHSGILAGTPHFLSPEQAAGQPTDARSDLFALGATLYFLATGLLPFPGEQTPSVLHAVAHAPHRPARQIIHGLPAWLSALLDALLAKNPARRPASATEVADALRRRSPRWSRRRRVILAGRVALLLVAAALTAFAITRWQAWQRGELHFAAAHPFQVTGSRDARFATLVEALAAARDGDVVLLERGGVFPLPAQHFRRRGLTLRASPRVGVILQPARLDTVLFTTGARLRLENLALEHPPTPAVAAPLLVAESGAEIILHRCRFSSPRLHRRYETFAENGAPLVRIAGGATVGFERSLILGQRRALAQFLPPAPDGAPARLRISECAITINTLLPREAGDASGQVEIRQSTLACAALVTLAPRTLPIAFHAERTFLDCMRSLVFAPGLDAAEVRRVVAWSGDGNAFHCEGAPLSFLPASTDRTVTAPATGPMLPEWRALFPGSDLRSIETASTLKGRLARTRPSVDPITVLDFTLPPDLRRFAPNVGARPDEIGPE